jgi:EmrB/QacA subfamily drug resistance transporter
VAHGSASPAIADRAVARRWPSPQAAVAIVYAVGMFMSIMDSQIVNVALATLGRDFSATPAQVQWIVTGYLLSLAVAIPVSGWLGDRFGTTRIYLISLSLFGAASALCAMAQDLPQLVGARVLQGLGGGLMTPVAMAMLYRAYPYERRVHVARTITRVTVIAPATAPIIGGVLVTGLSWHWIFLINVPVASAALVFGVMFLPRTPPADPQRFDLLGFVLSAGGLAALLYCVGTGPTNGWSNPTTWVPGVIGVAALALFARYSLRRPAPVLRLRLLRDRLFRSCCALIGCSTTAFFGSLVFTGLFLQEGLGLSALASGLTTFPEAVAIGLSSQVVARLYPRVGPRRLIIAGFLGLVVVNVAMSTAGADTSLWQVRGLMFAIGLAVSYVMLPTQAAAYARISTTDTGHATAIFTASQRSASALGVALLSVVLAAGSAGAIRAPVHAFHAVYLASAGAALVGALIALTIRDRDAASTMKRERGGREEVEARIAEAEI